ncbi:predicted protein [Phaeodactylum tricornutum CCAP 1055/1]|uniref:Uncharacterized protein n=1 Tax=Phaeodactylum tricornutum (strain CCAP 1055/1) TaxID=556484 RepID=B7G9S9_PHATC|nr:predicted protein [Phaeodactylum tricornutum CCAP 1055/1]EEC44612.1 predicted protein [Phaeodactylum tricornutum CCAP 1055/1]|eukprot:XP_002183943.1 predicted protein [Phaeodactylum tricornutum CCAP 1055/1]
MEAPASVRNHFFVFSCSVHKVRRCRFVSSDGATTASITPFSERHYLPFTEMKADKRPSGNGSSIVSNLKSIFLLTCIASFSLQLFGSVISWNSSRALGSNASRTSPTWSTTAQSPSPYPIWHSDCRFPERSHLPQASSRTLQALERFSSLLPSRI